jgi:iron complex outermembrane receptor protein
VARTLALFATEEVRVGRAALSIGGRVDDVQIRPLDSTETRLLTGVRTRRFRAATGALAGSVDVGGGLSLGATAARAFRPPAIEELYSAGPHLATYAYEIGNPRLRAEQGWGTDLFARLARPRLTAEVAAYAMWIDGFVYQSPRLDPVTGAPLLDPRLRRYQVYQASQTDARLTGVEGRLQWELARAWALDGTLSVARGTRTRGDSLGVVPAGAPLPAMPPIRGRLQLRRDGRAWLAGMTLEAAAAQSRIPVPTVPPASCTPGRLVDGVVSGLMPAEFCPTAGFTLVHLVVGRRWLVGNRLHSATLAIDNLFDATWRDHLWRAKQVAPQPGRNLRLLYRLTL